MLAIPDIAIRAILLIACLLMTRLPLMHLPYYDSSTQVLSGLNHTCGKSVLILYPITLTTFPDAEGAVECY